ncbi:hypothetical protein [Hymenobacter sp.]|uniref:hypothetical protein n=1 Tax=Hymenobacter sp. TaxID=1898978 RepID=UPI002EDAEEE5
MKKGFLVGLLGESPNDTASVEALLGPRYSERVKFTVISPEITGSQLDNPKFQHIIRMNYRFKKPDLVVVTRDLDAPASDRAQRLKRNEFFRKINSGLEGKGVYLLHVQAMEALIAADIRVFNARYECVCVVPDDPMTIADPAAFLKNATSPGKPHYDEGHCADLLSKVDYNVLLANCRYFSAFDQ